jgi:hypothetical protein
MNERMLVMETVFKIDVFPGWREGRRGVKRIQN